jgi:energy-coupling factor transporter ATP-binding protein EcfA2
MQEIMPIPRVYTTPAIALEQAVTTAPLRLPKGPTILIAGPPNCGKTRWYEAISMMAAHPSFADLPGPMIIDGKDVNLFLEAEEVGAANE